MMTRVDMSGKAGSDCKSARQPPLLTPISTTKAEGTDARRDVVSTVSDLACPMLQ